MYSEIRKISLKSYESIYNDQRPHQWKYLFVVVKEPV